MQSFLRQTAEHIYQTYTDQLSDLCIVLPTRRATLYFKNALAEAAPTGIWSPQIYSMEEFVCNMANVEVLEPLHLQLDLYDLMLRFDPHLDFDQFVGWSATLLEDFSRMDMELVDPKAVFEYVSEAKALERWDPAKPGSSVPTPNVKQYFQLWANLERTYHALHQKLSKDKQAYTGMAFRMVASRIKDIAQSDKGCFRYIFVGLNALSKAEQKIIQTLLEAGKADVFFDSDDYYMAPDSDKRAGHFLKRYKAKWPLPEWNWQQNLLLQDTKEINAIGVANASMQGKIAGQLLREIRQKDPKAEIAIVLPDETLLLPVLHSISDEVSDYNVTMGLSFKGTPLFNLVDLLFEVHLTGVVQPTDTGYKVNRYHHLAVTKLLQHPFLRRYEQYLNSIAERETDLDLFQHVLDEMVQRNSVLLTAQEIIQLGREHPMFITLFQTWNDCTDLIDSLYHLVDALGRIYRVESENPIETEYLFILYTIVKRLDTLFDCREHKISVRSFKKFLYEQIGNTKLPFSGEPISPTQVMGMLETRALDFENLIILSVNENVLPQPKKQNSLFPYDVLRTFGLPTYAEQESITSYYFYRLLQRAKRVNLLYVLPSDTYGSGEKSRFILQLQHDLALRNPNIKFRELTAVVEQLDTKEYEPDIIIQKDEVVLGKLKEQLRRGLYPSHLNQFVNCTLQYYFSRIAKLEEVDEIDELVGADTFGTIVHQVLEDYFRPFAEEAKPIQKADVDVMLANLPKKVQLEFKRGTLGNLPEQGMNLILYQVAVQLLTRYLENLRESEELPLYILQLEETLLTDLDVKLPSGEKVPVRIAGKADRIDLSGHTLRVIDYKTGKVEARNLKVNPEELETTLLHDRHLDKVRQLWLYRYILAKEIQKGSLLESKVLNLPKASYDFEAGIISFRNLGAGVLTSELPFVDAQGAPTDFIQTSERLLKELVLRMLNPEEPIRKTNDLETCQYCAYKSICARG
ncbi:PD-(D/E)XK nuclease family protein [Rufibacter latericius]|uniref:PD-(D/E)XK nuclease family protein n=1 Tax=Rufibacter latericius TaxID=2487040 RepID=A0A3M9MHI3_9BACT|nr:PD-(D/E)XK nuclease family protein [Rufibacter latericius]RNI25030.1 PD-(D/E)XK nuclease family protein [Rufibacter latericius]